MNSLIRIAIVTSLLGVSAAQAENCPEELPAGSATRRSQAKVWFSRGEAATAAGDQISALKAYQCSLKLVPHGFTAFNLAQVAEQIGDLELAISGYNQYILLVPDAADAQEVSDRIASLKERLTKLREEDLGAVEAAASGDTRTSPTNVSPLAASSRPLPKKHDMPVVQAPVPPNEPEEAITTPHRPRNSYRTVAWISLGTAVVLGTGGLVANLLARSKMDTCRSDYTRGDDAAAESSCSDAKPFAYFSYAAFGVGAAAAVLGTVFMFVPGDSSHVAMDMLPEGGLSLRWSGRF